VARHDRNQPLAYAESYGPFFDRRQHQLPVPVSNAANVGHRRGRPCAEVLSQPSRVVAFYKLVYRNAALFDAKPHVTEERNHTLPRDPGQYRPPPSFAVTTQGLSLFNFT